MHLTSDSDAAGAERTATPASIATLIENALSLLEVDRVASREYLSRAFALICGQAERLRHGAANPARGRLAMWQFRRVIAHIDANLTSTLQTDELATLVHLSVSHFFRAFKVSVGMSPRQYILHRRVDRARELMTTSNEPLSQIALACGLNDQSSLCRVFRRVVGQSPSVWRRANATEPGSLTVQPRRRFSS